MMRGNIFMLVLAAVVFAAALPASAGQVVLDDGQRPQYLFVVSSLSGSHADGVLTLSGAPLAVYFSDRPHRVAGHMSLAEFAGLWEQGGDGFTTDPPNAALSILGAQGDPVVLEILSAATPEPGVLRMEVRPLQGELPADFQAASLFVDQDSTIKTPGVY